MEGKMILRKGFSKTFLLITGGIIIVAGVLFWYLNRSSADLNSSEKGKPIITTSKVNTTVPGGVSLANITFYYNSDEKIYYDDIDRYKPDLLLSCVPSVNSRYIEWPSSTLYARGSFNANYLGDNGVVYVTEGKLTKCEKIVIVGKGTFKKTVSATTTRPTILPSTTTSKVARTSTSTTRRATSTSTTRAQ